MSKPHVHVDMICEWAMTGRQVQFNKHGIWVDCFDKPAWHEDRQYRFKPEVKRYRVALVGDHTNTVNTEEQAENFERMIHFIRWLTDWIEYEV